MKKCLFVFAVLSLVMGTAHAGERWSVERANAWYAKQPWLVGANYVPATAINQLEMWQADSFDPKTIDKELGWAASLGFTSMRVFLHHLLWEQDAEGLLKRIDQYLTISAQHNIGTMLVLFDGVWDPHPKVGKQRAPRPHVHNSGWVQSPGAELLKDYSRYDSLRPYVQGVIRRFKDDPRVQIWDLFNEPDNMNVPRYRKHEPKDKPERVERLLAKSFKWARDVNPTQPLTAAIWLDYQGFMANPPIYQLMLAESDILSFHNYGPPEDMEKEVTALKRMYKRPLLCTEFMARTVDSTFDPILGYLQENQVGAYCWGLVEGKSQTNYPWESWEKAFIDEPLLWHHDIFRGDGSPYRQAEVDYIKSLTGAK